jgi:hypothetical protein
VKVQNAAMRASLVHGEYDDIKIELQMTGIQEGVWQKVIQLLVGLGERWKKNNFGRKKLVCLVRWSQSKGQCESAGLCVNRDALPYEAAGLCVNLLVKLHNRRGCTQAKQGGP